MRIDSAGLPFVGLALALGAVAGASGLWALAALLLFLGGFFLFFFRDPDRVAPPGADVVLAPADANAAPPGSWLQVSIFLSPMDVHVNRIPVSGRVTRVVFTRGRFLPAYRHDAAAVNERSELWIDHGGQTIVARQVVGILARRVVCRVEAGADVRAGDRFGIMKFGSRMDVFLPLTAMVRVKVGDAVRGGETVMAVLHSGHG